MTKRPIAVTLIACLLIVAGVVGITYHAREFDTAHPFAFGSIWILLIRALAILAGIFLLRHANWARWLAMAWIAFHVVISFYHPISQLVVHAIVFIIFALCLFNSRANAYFKVAD